MRNNPFDRIIELLQQDEGETLEFKGTFKYDVKTKVPKKELQEEVIQTIAGFLNKKGGTILIGIEDGTKKILGLQNYDLKLYRDLDVYYQDIVNKIDEFIGSEYSSLMEISFIEIENNKICVIDVSSSPSEVWYKHHDFYLRMGNTTRKQSPRKAHEYIKKQWYSNVRKTSIEQITIHKILKKYLYVKRHNDFISFYTVPKNPTDNLIPLESQTKQFLQKPIPKYLSFGSLKITSNGYQFHNTNSDTLVEITKEGFIYYRESSPMPRIKDKNDNKICIERNAMIAVRMIEYAKKIYDKFNYQSDLCVGLELTNIKNKVLFSGHDCLLQSNPSNMKDYFGIKTFNFNSFLKTVPVVKYFLNESSRYFGLELEDSYLENMINNSLDLH